MTTLHSGIGTLSLASCGPSSSSKNQCFFCSLWMNVPWDKEGKLENKAPASKPGDYVTLRADMDAVIVFSACPNVRPSPCVAQRHILDTLR